MNKIAVFTNEEGYHNALKLSEQKKKLFSQMIDALQCYDLTVKESEELRRDPVGYMERLYLEKHKARNSMDLSFQKLALLLEDDFSTYKSLCAQYAAIPIDETKSIKLEDFTTYADKPEQIKRFEAVAMLIKGLEAMKEVEPKISFAIEGSKFPRWIRKDQNGKIIPHPNFIFG